MSAEVECRTYSTEDVSKIMGLGINKTREIIRRPDFPKVMIGKNRWIILREPFDEWLRKLPYKNLT